MYRVIVGILLAAATQIRANKLAVDRTADAWDVTVKPMVDDVVKRASKALVRRASLEETILGKPGHLGTRETFQFPDDLVGNRRLILNDVLSLGDSQQLFGPDKIKANRVGFNLDNTTLGQPHRAADSCQHCHHFHFPRLPVMFTSGAKLGFASGVPYGRNVKALARHLVAGVATSVAAKRGAGAAKRSVAAAAKAKGKRKSKLMTDPMPVDVATDLDGAAAEATGNAGVLTVDVIAAELDGVLLDSSYRCSARNVAAVRAAMEAGITFIPVTGKSRKGALETLGVESGGLGRELENGPGIFLQGLQVFGPGGELVSERFLDDGVVVAAARFCDDNRDTMTLVGYSGSLLLADRPPRDTRFDHWRLRDERCARLTATGEPEPMAAFPPLETKEALRGGRRIHKLVLVYETDEGFTDEHVRKGLETVLLDPRLAPWEEFGDYAGERANASNPIDNTGAYQIEQAVSGVIEIVPPGVSKAAALRELLPLLGHDADGASLLAIGDYAIGDAELLDFAALGVALGNAPPWAATAADITVEETNDEDAAGLVIEQYALGKNYQKAFRKLDIGETLLPSEAANGSETVYE